MRAESARSFCSTMSSVRLAAFDAVLFGSSLTSLHFASPLAYRLRLGEFPCAVEDLGVRPIEGHDVVPAGHDRQPARDLAASKSPGFQLPSKAAASGP